MVLLSVIQGGGELLLTQVNTTIACFVPACISLVAIIAAREASGVPKGMERGGQPGYGAGEKIHRKTEEQTGRYDTAARICAVHPLIRDRAGCAFSGAGTYPPQQGADRILLPGDRDRIWICE